MARVDMKALAQLGASARIAELEAELAEIRKTFPALATRRRVQDGGAGGTLLPEGGKKKRRQRAPMSAAQRRAVGVRMKKYWAQRRKANA